METEIRNISDVVGHTLNKSILSTKLSKDEVPQFMIFYGESGTCKSTLAEWVAMSSTCTERYIQACLQCPTCKANLEALKTTGVSRNIKKVNMAALKGKDDMLQLIKEIFTLQWYEDEKIFYILEEVHELGEYQGMLLEELARIQPNVHIIMCTTEIHKLLDTLKTRANLKLQFKTLEFNECLMLVDRLLKQRQVTCLTDADKAFLVNATKHNAREITNTIESLANIPELPKVLRKYFSGIMPDIYLQVLNKLFSPFPNYIMFLDELSENVDMVTLWNGMHEFLRNCLFYMYGKSATLFTNGEKEQIENIFRQLDSNKAYLLWKRSNVHAKDKLQAELYLTDMREIVNGPVSIDKSKADAVKENTMAQEEHKKVHNNKIVKKEIEKLTMEGLHNISKNSKLYK